MNENIIDEPFEWRAPTGPARCRLRIGKIVIDDRLRIAVIVTELPGNPGMSVTNDSENLIENIRREYGARLGLNDKSNCLDNQVLLFEHYPERNGTPATWDRIRPDRHPRERWRRVTDAERVALVLLAPEIMAQEP